MYFCEHLCHDTHVDANFGVLSFTWVPGSSDHRIVWQVPFPAEPAASRALKFLFFLFSFMCLAVRVVGPLEVGLQTVMGCHVDAQN